uniref:Uncharacterized protein n=2 Tax=Chrysotila carterae TaxID=13221 RepID=A0A7S4B457_CHRCT
MPVAGVYEERWDLPSDACREACSLSSKCQGYEFVGITGYQRCELHSTMPTHTVPINGYMCYTKDTPQARLAWTGRSSILRYQATGPAPQIQLVAMPPIVAVTQPLPFPPPPPSPPPPPPPPALTRQTSATVVAVPASTAARIRPHPPPSPPPASTFSLVRAAPPFLPLPAKTAARTRPPPSPPPLQPPCPDLSGVMQDKDFRTCDFVKVDLSGRSMERGNFEGVRLLEATMDSAVVEGGTLDNIFGLGLSAREINAKDARFRRAFLESADFRLAHLEGSYFEDAVLFRANFKDASLDKAVLDGVNAAHSIFDGAKMTTVSAESADFSEASLRKADFAVADLKNTRFLGADVTGASFKDADLTGAQFAGAIGLDTCDFTGSMGYKAPTASTRATATTTTTATPTTTHFFLP